MNYDIIQKYLLHCRDNKKLSSHTIRAYKIDIEKFYNSKYTNVITYVKYLINSDGLKATTQKRKIASLKAFYSYLYETKYIHFNPFYKHRFNFRNEKTLPKIISVADLTKIYNYLQEELSYVKTEYLRRINLRNFLIVSLLISTGLRVSELCNLTIKQIDIENRTITIFGKGKKERLIFIGEDNTYRLLHEYIIKYQNKYLFLFRGQSENKPLSEQSVRLLLKNISKKIKINKNITPHMFRHSFATMLLDSDVDIRYIQQILGHSSITVTQIYTHVTQNKQREILSKNNPLKKINKNRL